MRNSDLVLNAMARLSPDDRRQAIVEATLAVARRHGLGATTVRDALRRLWVENQDGKWDVNIFSRVETVVVASGANHGVVSFSKQCGLNLTMRGTVTCETSRLKLFTPRSRARRTAMALAGAVVSNPTAKNTTSRSGWRRASSTASSGLYTTRTVPPRART